MYLLTCPCRFTTTLAEVWPMVAMVPRSHVGASMHMSAVGRKWVACHVSVSPAPILAKIMLGFRSFERW